MPTWFIDDGEEAERPWPLLRRLRPGLYHHRVAFERITIDPSRMGGVPCIRDLRVTVGLVLGQLAAGGTVEELLTDYPYLERADILAALKYASAIVNEREVPIARPA